MDGMDVLFPRYNEYFDHLEDEVRRVHQKDPAHNPSAVLAKRMTREEFERYLNNGRETESKRLFLRRILSGNDQLLAVLPDNLRSLAERAA